MTMRAFLPLLILATGSSSVAAQSGTLDQSSTFGNTWFNGGVSVLTWQQEIKTGLAGTLEGIAIEISGAAGATLDLRIRLGSGWNTGSVIASAVATAAGTGTWERVFVDLTSAGVVLATGATFVMEIQGNAGLGVHGHWIGPPASSPYPEELLLNGPGCYADCGYDLGFETYMLSGPQLTKSGTCPGLVQLSVTDATPNGAVAMLYGPGGSFTQTGSPCTGLTIAIGMPTLGGILTADASGAATVSFNAPAALCGVTVQGVDLATCEPTNPITL